MHLPAGLEGAPGPTRTQLWHLGSSLPGTEPVVLLAFYLIPTAAHNLFHSHRLPFGKPSPFLSVPVTENSVMPQHAAPGAMLGSENRPEEPHAAEAGL